MGTWLVGWSGRFMDDCNVEFGSHNGFLEDLNSSVMKNANKNAKSWPQIPRGEGQVWRSFFFPDPLRDRIIRLKVFLARLCVESLVLILLLGGASKVEWGVLGAIFNMKFTLT